MTSLFESGVITSLSDLDPEVVAKNPNLLLSMQRARLNFQAWQEAVEKDAAASVGISTSSGVAETITDNPEAPNPVEVGKKIGDVVARAAAVLTPEAEQALGQSTLSPDENTVLAASLALATQF